jgi:uncharacterized membrane protein HdeD (DUF308 family)
MTIDKIQIKASAVGKQEYISGRMGKVWWSFLLRGLLAIAFGIAAVFWPDKTLTLLIQLVGLFALLDGVTSLISTLRTREYGSYLISGLISLAVGGILLFWPGVTAKLLLIILGIWAVIQAAGLIVSGRQSSVDDPDRNILLTIGGIAAVIGIALIFWPATGAVAISWILAAIAFIAGALLISLALRLRRANQQINNLTSR